MSSIRQFKIEWEIHGLLFFCGMVFHFGCGLTSVCGAAENNQTAVQENKKQQIDFTQQIQPLLAKHCYVCHGPDLQEGGLRLDQRERAFKQLESEAIAVVPFHPDKSEMIVRLTSRDPDQQMPPEGERLKQEEIELITNWIQQGARWKKHWAFQPPQKSHYH